MICYEPWSNPALVVKMRAVASGAPLNKSFFIVIDRLYDTLDKRIVTWLETYNANKGGLFGRGANKEELSKLMLQRLVVAYDLAAAFSYMHGHQYVLSLCRSLYTYGASHPRSG